MFLGKQKYMTRWRIMLVIRKCCLEAGPVLKMENGIDLFR